MCFDGTSQWNSVERGEIFLAHHTLDLLRTKIAPKVTNSVKDWLNMVDVLNLYAIEITEMETMVMWYKVE